jgi:LPXTG-motif cell wall-anchored protein
MDVKQSMLRLAAATAVTVFVGVGAVGPVHALDGKSNDKSASSQGAQKSADAKDSKDSTATGSHHTEGNASTTGEYNEPQPESTADQNDGGANAGTCPEGQYCSTRDGSASQNGEGDGKATGRPCMGCVGKADNKNPNGQVGESPSKNKGYECDDNKGIGKGNPAHTGCTDGTTTPSEGQPATVCPEGSTMNDAGECVVPPTKVTCPEGSTMNDAGECVLPTKQETCPQDATMNEAGECVLPTEEVTCPEDATMNSEGECIVPAVPSQTGPGQVAPESGNEVLGVQAERRPSAGVAGSTANRAAALVAPMAGILPSTGAGQYGLVIVGGIVLLIAGGVLLARRRPQADR